MLKTSPSYECENGSGPSVAETHLNFIRVELLLMLQHESLHVSSLLDRCPREMSSLSCEVQRDTTAPGNLGMHYAQTPSCLINKKIVCSTERNNRLTIFWCLLQRSLWVVVEDILLFFLSFWRDDKTDLSVGSSSAVALVKL